MLDVRKQVALNNDTITLLIMFDITTVCWELSYQKIVSIGSVSEIGQYLEREYIGILL